MEGEYGWRGRGESLLSGGGEAVYYSTRRQHLIAKNRAPSGFFTYLKGKNISCSGTFSSRTYIIYRSYFSRATENAPPRSEASLRPWHISFGNRLENARRTRLHREREKRGHLSKMGTNLQLSRDRRELFIFNWNFFAGHTHTHTNTVVCSIRFDLYSVLHGCPRLREFQQILINRSPFLRNLCSSQAFINVLNCYELKMHSVFQRISFDPLTD